MEVDKLPYKDLVALAKSLDVPNAGQTARAALVTAVQEKIAAGVQPKTPEAAQPPAEPKPRDPPAQPQPSTPPADALVPPAPPAEPPAPPAPQPEPPADDTPKCVRVLRSAWIEKDGRRTQVHLRDVFSGDFAAFLWKTYPKLVERYPITKR
jgi:hypothetical protein